MFHLHMQRMGSAFETSICFSVTINNNNSNTPCPIYRNELRLMCWWGFKVFLKVFGNLAGRILADTLDASYKICATMLCQCGCTNTGNSAVTNVQRSTLDNSKTVHEFINEPREQFYQDVDRNEVEAMLENKQNGTFVIRPSTFANSLGTLSIMQDNRIFHLNIRQRDDDTIALGTEKINEKYFVNVNALIDYHISNYLILYSEGETYRTLLLPYHG